MIFVIQKHSMMFITKHNVFALWIFVQCFRIYYCLEIIPERAKITFTNSKYVNETYVNVRRYERNAPYYINLEGTNLQTWGNNVSIMIDFYEYLHNEFRQSFVQLKFKLCDLINKDKYIGPVIKKTISSCPLKPQHYGLHNMTWLNTSVDGFKYEWPFEKGKAQVTIRTDREVIAEGYLVLSIVKSKIQLKTSK